MTPQTITITTARGETFTMNFDGPVSVEVKDVHLSPFEVGDMTPHTPDEVEFAVGDRVEWTDWRGGVGSGIVSYIFGHALKIDDGKVILAKYARKVTPSAAPKFKVGDVVYWDMGHRRLYGRISIPGIDQVGLRILTLSDINMFMYVDVDILHHDYRTVAGGGWRKCEVGRAYRTRNGNRMVYNSPYHDDSGEARDGAHGWDLVEELP